MAQAISKEILVCDLQTTIMQKKSDCLTRLCFICNWRLPQVQKWALPKLVSCSISTIYVLMALIFAGLCCDYLLKDYPQEVTWRMWTSSGKQSPPWISIMNDKQKTSGAEFEAAVARQIQFLHESVGSSNSFTVDCLSTF
jgi:hypothetical protein